MSKYPCMRRFLVAHICFHWMCEYRVFSSSDILHAASPMISMFLTKASMFHVSERNDSKEIS